jgi:hypothetical protein
VALKLFGNLSIDIKTPDGSDMIGTKVSLKEGQKEISHQVITGNKITFENVPNGVYHLEFTGDKMREYNPDNVYVYVKNSHNDAKVTFSKVTNNPINNQELKFVNSSNVYVGGVRTDFSEKGKKAIISILEKTPQPFYYLKDYIKIYIKSSEGEIKYKKEIQGVNQDGIGNPDAVGTDEIQLVDGDVIEIFHAETPTQLTSDEDIINKNSLTNQWTVTKYGLQNETLELDAQQFCMRRIDKLGAFLLEEEDTYPIPFELSTRKKQLYGAITSLEEPFRTEYLEKFSDLFE